jgi:hypothetical protein
VAGAASQRINPTIEPPPPRPKEQVVGRGTPLRWLPTPGRAGARPTFPKESVVNDMKKCRYTIPERFKSRWGAAMGGKSRKAAIDVFCLMCVGFERESVRGCTAPDCPLFKFRPYQTDVEDAEKPPKRAPVNGFKKRGAEDA